MIKIRKSESERGYSEHNDCVNALHLGDFVQTSQVLLVDSRFRENKGKETGMKIIEAMWEGLKLMNILVQIWIKTSGEHG